jgi:hypothetical protein
MKNGVSILIYSGENDKLEFIGKEEESAVHIGRLVSGRDVHGKQRSCYRQDDEQRRHYTSGCRTSDHWTATQLSNTSSTNGKRYVDRAASMNAPGY